MHSEIIDPPATARAHSFSFVGAQGRFAHENQPAPFQISPDHDGEDLIEWTKLNRPALDETLVNYGAILLRGFRNVDPDSFQTFSSLVYGEFMDYIGGLTPRKQILQNVYTSTELHPGHPIPLHSELAFSSLWPAKISFYCATPPLSGGQTPIASTVGILENLSSDLQNKLKTQKVTYIRNFQNGNGPVFLTWQKAFQTDSKSQVEAACSRLGIDFRWKSGDRLQTKETRFAVARHPKTQHLVWFNHVALFHPYVLGKEIYQQLTSVMDKDDLATSVHFEDGSEITPQMIEEILTALKSECIQFDWHQGDVLLLDNMLFAHGRNPFTGPRQILVTMGDEVNRNMLAETEQTIHAK